ncbi:MAG: hypothetical protein IKU03_04815 [Bacteroidales bacterium]|nr:hypothetical protein [Bacteroidales bacterium]
MQFKDVLVPQELKDQLLQQIHDGRISHAQLFHSQPGNHSFALAVAMGQYLCCEHPSETDSCGECPSCKQFEKLEHPDLHLYFPNCGTDKIDSKDCESSLFLKEFREYALANNLHIDLPEWISILGGANKKPAINVRDASRILHFNSMRAYAGKYKVYILWRADRLHPDCGQKLLKTLEEPEENSIFILIAEEPEYMLPTILSRTQTVKFPRLSNEAIEQALLKEHPDLSPEVAHNITLHADHNYIKARRSYPNDELAAQMLDTFQAFTQGVVAYAQRQPLDKVNFKGTQDLINDMTSLSKEDLRQHLLFWQDLSRKFLLMKAGNDQLVMLTDAEKETYEQLKSAFTLRSVSQLNEALNVALLHIVRNGNPSLILTDLYFQFASFLMPKK